MIKIDVDTRCWKIPKEEAFLGVESDDKVRILQFELSKNEFCDGLNFTDCNCFINYKNEGNDTIPYLITDMEVQEDGTVTFTWEVSRLATIFKGNTFAILCAKKVSEDGTITNEWNSRIGSFTVSKGLEPLSSITEVPEIDIISQLLSVAKQANTNAKNNIDQSSLLLEKAEGLGYLKEDFDVLEARMNQFTSLQEGSTTGDAELIDGRIGYDGTVYDNIGGAIRGQVSELKGEIADKATLENGVVKFWKTSTEENRTDTLLYSVDISSIGGTGGLDLENLTLSVSQVGNYQRLSMSDGTTTKNVDIPITTITDEQVSTAVQKYLEENPVSALDASTAKTNQVPVADGNGNWSWQTQQSGTGSEETDPTVPNWAKQPNKPTYTASEVGADAAGTAESKVSAHNTATDAHNDIRLLVQGLTKRLNAKVGVSDIINNLISNNADKPLSAKQGRVLKSLIDAIIVPTKLSELENDSVFLTEHQVNNLIDAKLTGVETLLGGGF